MNYFEIIGRNIQMALEDKNLSQDNLASKLNISKQTLLEIIGGRKAISLREITAIAESIPIAPKDLLHEPENKSQADELVFIRNTILEYMKLEDRLLKPS